jgi:hypothetical protein
VKIDGHVVANARRRCWRPDDSEQLKDLQIIARAIVYLNVDGGIEGRIALLVASTATRNLGERFYLVLEQTTGALLLLPSAEVA